MSIPKNSAFAVNGGSTRISKPQGVQIQFRLVGCLEWEWTEVRRQSQVLIPVIWEDTAMKLGGRHGGVLFPWSADHVFCWKCTCDGVSRAPVAFSKCAPTRLNHWKYHCNWSQGTNLGSASLISQWLFNHKIGEGAVGEGRWGAMKPPRSSAAIGTGKVSWVGVKIKDTFW